MFDNGKFLGSYSEKEGIIKRGDDFNIISSIWEEREGTLTFYQTSLEEFDKLRFPSLRFGYIEEEIGK